MPDTPQKTSCPASANHPLTSDWSLTNTEPPVLRARLFDAAIAHGFSTRLGGVSLAPFDSLNLGPAGQDSRDNILENFERFCRAVGVRREALVLGKQIHEAHVQPVTRSDCGQGLSFPVPSPRDALMTDRPGVTLCVFTADCVPVLLYDPVTPAVAAVHAGWRGTALGIVNQTVRAMSEQYGTDPLALCAAVGPSIGACCFLVHDDVLQPMREVFGEELNAVVNRVGDRWSMDLKQLNVMRLLRAGVPRGQIAVSDHCTCCREDLFFSHRRMGARRGLMAAVIGIKEEEHA